MATFYFRIIFWWLGKIILFEWELIPLENKHYKTKLRHQLFGTERGFIELTISTEGEGKTKDKQ